MIINPVVTAQEDQHHSTYKIDRPLSQTVPFLTSSNKLTVTDPDVLNERVDQKVDQLLVLGMHLVVLPRNTAWLVFQQSSTGPAVSGAKN